MRYSKWFLIMAFPLLLVSMGSCRKGREKAQEARQEDLGAKKMLQGIWVDEDEQDVAFKAKVIPYTILTQPLSLYTFRSLTTPWCCMVLMRLSILSSNKRAISLSSATRTVTK